MTAYEKAVRDALKRLVADGDEDAKRAMLELADARGRERVAEMMRLGSPVGFAVAKMLRRV